MPAAVALAGAMLVGAPVRAAPSVWVVDDGEKIRRDAVDTPFERGEDDAIWRPGEPARLFAMRNESVALQVVVEAGGSALDGVTVDLDALAGPADAKIENDVPASFVGRPIERFVEHFVTVRRPSGGMTSCESLGWEQGSGPPADAWVGPVPDALIPVERAPAWDPYPMHVAPHTNGIVWIDLNVPRGQDPGAYRGRIRVRAGDRDLADIPVELEVARATLPDRTVAAMVYVDHDEIVRRMAPSAERQLWQLLHAHRVTPMHDAVDPSDVLRQRDALDGSLYTREHGYAGPAAGRGDGVLCIGAYGALGAPGDGALARAKAVADAADRAQLPEDTDVFLYAADEQCSSAWGAAWRRLLRESTDPALRKVRVAWTCTMDPAAQPVDVPMLLAAWDPAGVAAAREEGKDPWVYNGVLPRTGTFLLDADAVSPRVNGWLQAMFGIPRWFYWDAAHWTDEHGARILDPFAEPESLHNADGDWANGDGVLVYPGRQTGALAEHSLGFDGVVPSIRLKNWRRGIEDAGVLQMARERDPAAADRVARWLVPAAFGEATSGQGASWSSRGRPFAEARRALLAIVLGKPAVPLESRPPHDAEAHADARGSGAATGALLAALLAGAVVLRRRRSKA